jgi:hypothetical protein
MTHRARICAALVAAILSIRAAPPASAQAATVSISLQVRDCTGRTISNATVYMNGRPYQTDSGGNSHGGPVAPGQVQIRAVAPGAPNLVVSYVNFYPAGVSGSSTAYANLEGNVTFNTGTYSGELVVVMCAGKAMTHVRIATTTSCTDDPNAGFAIQPGVTVRIGTQSYTSNAKGVIELDLPAGDYAVAGVWKDYAFGYVAQNGLRQRKGEDGTARVSLGGSAETLEVRMLTCEPNGQPKARAVVTELGGGLGTIVVRTKVQGNAFVGMQLRDGDVVHIRQDAKIKWLADNGTIAFDKHNYTIVTIGPDTKPAGTTAPAEVPRPGAVELIRGVLQFLSPAEPPPDGPTDANGHVLFSTHTAVLKIDGTQFTLGYDPQTQTTTVDLKRGRVSITPRNPTLRPFSLSAGQKVSVSMDRIGPIAGVAIVSPARSAHGCTGFDGRWQSPFGIMQLRSGTGVYSDSSRGTVSIHGTSLAGTTLSGWYAFSAGSGTFVFTLAPNGDSFGTSFTSSAGVRGTYTVMQCVGQ